MQRLSKTIGVAIMAFSVAAVVDSSAQYIRDLPDKDLCQSASDARVQGSNFSSYLAEAAKRGLTADACRQLGKEPFPPTSSSPESKITDGEHESGITDCGTSEQREFLEAAAFVLTGVDATRDEIVSNRQIILHEYPIVMYLVANTPCTVRMRNPERQRINQWDFCKFTVSQSPSVQRSGCPMRLRRPGL